MSDPKLGERYRASDGDVWWVSPGTVANPHKLALFAMWVDQGVLVRDLEEESVHKRRLTRRALKKGHRHWIRQCI